MSTPSQPKSIRLSTYILPDLSTEEVRRQIQFLDRLHIDDIDTLVPEQPDPTHFGSVLDINCDAGTWILGMARAYQNISQLVSMNVSRQLVEYGRAKAEAQHLSDRVTFQLMDALRVLDFPNHSFDLVNIALGQFYLRTWDWPNFLKEFVRVSQPGGTIRITDIYLIESNSQNLNRLIDIGRESMYQAGYYFTLDRDGNTNGLIPLLQHLGLADIQTYSRTQEYCASTPEGQLFVHSVTDFLVKIRGFLQKWLRLPNDYEELYQKVLAELHDPSFVATSPILTIWGTTPEISL